MAIILVITVALYALVIGVGFVASALLDDERFSSVFSFSAFFVILMAAQPFVFVGVGYVLAIRRWGLTWRDCGFTPMRWYWYLLIPLVIWPVSLPVVGGLKMVVDLLLGTPGVNPYAETFDALGPISPSMLIYIVVLGGIVVPISEEFLFRGLLYPWLRSRWRVFPAVVMSSLLFAAMHVHPAVVAPVFLLGVIMALLREYGRSLWAPILFHAVHNSAMFLVMFSLIAAGQDFHDI